MHIILNKETLKKENFYPILNWCMSHDVKEVVFNCEENDLSFETIFNFINDVREIGYIDFNVDANIKTLNKNIKYLGLFSELHIKVSDEEFSRTDYFEDVDYFYSNYYINNANEHNSFICELNEKWDMQLVEKLFDVITMLNIKNVGVTIPNKNMLAFNSETDKIINIFSSIVRTCFFQGISFYKSGPFMPLCRMNFEDLICLSSIYRDRVFIINEPGNFDFYFINKDKIKYYYNGKYETIEIENIDLDKIDKYLSENIVQPMFKNAPDRCRNCIFFKNELCNRGLY